MTWKKRYQLLNKVLVDFHLCQLIVPTLNKMYKISETKTKL